MGLRASLHTPLCTDSATGHAGRYHRAATLLGPRDANGCTRGPGPPKRPSSLHVLSQGVYDPEPPVRAFAAGALGEFGQPGAVAPLTHALGDEHARVRAVAAASLGRVGTKDSRPLLHALTRDASLQVRASSVEGLLRLGDHTAVLVAATDLARHPDPSVRASASPGAGLQHPTSKHLHPPDASTRSATPTASVRGQNLGKTLLACTAYDQERSP